MLLHEPFCHSDMRFGWSDTLEESRFREPFSWKTISLLHCHGVACVLSPAPHLIGILTYLLIELTHNQLDLPTSFSKPLSHRDRVTPQITHVPNIWSGSGRQRRDDQTSDRVSGKRHAGSILLLQDMKQKNNLCGFPSPERQRKLTRKAKCSFQ